ncbi:MAG: DUF2141 domain-containing protein [Pseudohongiellaceae bacterium]
MKFIPTQYALKTLTLFTTFCAAAIARSLANPIKNYRFRYLPILVLTGGLSHPLQAADVELTIENITEVSGTLYWSVYDSEDTYKSEEHPVVAAQSKVTGEMLKVTLHDLPEGDYAVKLFHDANDNGEMDSNLIGIPQEGYGFSNNGGAFGPSSYSDAKVKVEDNTLITIRLR